MLSLNACADHEYNGAKPCPDCKRVKDNLRIKEIFKTLNLCSLSYRQEELIQSLEDQFNAKGTLSDKQVNLLMDIYERS